jgi:lysozyme family protein
MDRNFNRAVTATLKYEGGYVNDPKDAGGATNRGITLATFRRYIKPTGTIADLKALTEDQAKTVYRRQYWDAVSGAQLPDGLDFAVFDFGVNSGPDRAIKRLQKIAGVPQDGRIGPTTIKAVIAIPLADSINKYQDERLAFLKGLKTWPHFGKGWGDRVKQVRILALQMAASPSIPSVPDLLAQEKPETGIIASKPTVRNNQIVDKPIKPLGISAGIIAIIAAGFYGIACHLPTSFIEWAGYAAKCTGN